MMTGAQWGMCLKAGRRTLNPQVRVRILLPQPCASSGTANTVGSYPSNPGSNPGGRTSTTRCNSVRQSGPLITGSSLVQIQPPRLAGWRSSVSRQAHNLEAVGSNPTPATTSGWLPDARGSQGEREATLRGEETPALTTGASSGGCRSQPRPNPTSLPSNSVGRVLAC